MLLPCREQNSGSAVAVAPTEPHGGAPPRGPWMVRRPGDKKKPVSQPTGGAGVCVWWWWRGGVTQHHGFSELTRVSLDVCLYALAEL